MAGAASPPQRAAIPGGKRAAAGAVELDGSSLKTQKLRDILGCEGSALALVAIRVDGGSGTLWAWHSLQA